MVLENIRYVLEKCLKSAWILWVLACMNHEIYGTCIRVIFSHSFDFYLNHIYVSEALHRQKLFKLRRQLQVIYEYIELYLRIEKKIITRTMKQHHYTYSIGHYQVTINVIFYFGGLHQEFGKSNMNLYCILFIWMHAKIWGTR